MNQQEFKSSSLDGVDKIQEGALQMIKSLEKVIKQNYSHLGEEGAVKLAEAMNAAKLDQKIKDFEKEIKDLHKSFK